MKTSSFFRIFRSAALVLGFVFGLFFAGQARANYIDGANLYGGYFAEKVGMDSSGQVWTDPKRNSGARANVEGDCQDTVATLADMVKLEPSEFNKWLKDEDGGGLPSSESEKLNRKRKFSIPNTVSIMLGEASGSLSPGGAWADADANSEFLKMVQDKNAEGYLTVACVSGASKTTFNEAVQDEDTTGIMWSGHGVAVYDSSIPIYRTMSDSMLGVASGPSGKDNDFNSISLSRGKGFKKSFMVLYACYAGFHKGWADYVSKTGDLRADSGFIITAFEKYKDLPKAN